MRREKKLESGLLYTSGSLNDGLDEQRILSDALRHEQHAFWDAESFAQRIPTTFLQQQQQSNTRRR